MRDIEVEVREMLERRARDIPETDQKFRDETNRLAPRATAPVRGEMARSSRTRALAGVGAAILVFGLVALLSINRDSTSQIDTAQSVVTEPERPSSTEPAPVTSNTTDPDPVDTAPLATFESVADQLPPGVNLANGPLVFAGRPGDDADAIAIAYLQDRLPDLPSDLAKAATDDVLTLYQWTIAADQGELFMTGALVVRIDEYEPGVVAATTNGVDLTGVERVADRIAGKIADSHDDLLVLDLFNIRGEILPSSPNPEGFNDGEDPIFGTAGAAGSGLLDFDIAAGPIPVVVRAQHVGGTWLSITEFTLETLEFETECGATPPVTVDVGEQLGNLQAGVAPQARAGQLVNQNVWHYPGETDAIEIRWPADPSLSERLSPQEFEGGPIGLLYNFEATSPSGAETKRGGQHVLGLVGESATEPCSVVQVSIYGSDAAVEWWADAILGEWSFGLPLSVADLDPAIGPEGSGGDADIPPERNEELVVRSESADSRTVVPLTGSCDGLPDAAPRSGPGNGTRFDTAQEALADFLARQRLDPPVPRGGYTEVIIDDDAVKYVIGETNPVVVIDAIRDDQGWAIETWSAAAC